MPKYIMERFDLIERKTNTVPYISPDVHYHNKYELYYQEKGSTRYFIADEIFILQPGDIAFIPKGVFHKTASEGNTDIVRVLIVFDDNIINENYHKYIAALCECKYIRVPDKMQNVVSQLIHNIEAEDKKQSDGYQDMQSLYLSELLITLCRYKDTTKKIKLKDSYEIIQNAAKYISENFSSDLTLISLAEHSAMSPNHFSRQFKLVTGIGPNEYINIARINAAEAMLISTDKSITQIAFECGFNDSNYFSAVFKKMKGITPKKYSLLNKQ